jgi:outer membrane protein TolC
VNGREKVAMAHLQYQRSGDAKDMARLNEARYEARYEVAKEMCDDQAGNAKDVCLAQARAERDKAKANVQMAKNVTEASRDADATKAEADYKVARERCDAMSGNAKDACVASARARYGQ